MSNQYLIYWWYSSVRIANWASWWMLVVEYFTVQQATIAAHCAAKYSRKVQLTKTNYCVQWPFFFCQLHMIKRSFKTCFEVFCGQALVHTLFAAVWQRYTVVWGRYTAKTAVHADSLKIWPTACFALKMFSDHWSTQIVPGKLGTQENSHSDSRWNAVYTSSVLIKN